MGSSALMVFAVLQGVLANLFVLKQITLFGWTVTCSDVFAIGAILSLNLLQETWGQQEAAKTIRISVLSLVFFAVMAQMHLFYLPSPFDVTQSAYRDILSASPRIVFSSIAVYYVVQKLDVRIFSFLKRTFLEKYLPIRLLVSLLFSQFLDTFLFSFLGLYGLVESVFDIIVMSYLIKCLIIASSSAFVGAVKRYVRPS